jgi:hypothetical protein
MDFHKQSRRAREKMEQGLRDGKTCIDCHKGIANKNRARTISTPPKSGGDGPRHGLSGNLHGGGCCRG